MAMSFGDLPVELQLDILEQLQPQWSFNFAISCKEHYESCRSVLSHHTVEFSKCQTIDLEDPESFPIDGEYNVAWKVLQAIFEDPRKGWYITELEIPWRRLNEWTDEDGFSIPFPEENGDIFKAAARSLADLYPLTDHLDSAQDIDCRA